MSIVGTWQLSSWSALWAQELELKKGAVEEFLYQETAIEFGKSNHGEKTTGSFLTILDDRSFLQRGKGTKPVLTYDAEGCQVAGVSVFDGILREEGERSYLLRRDLPKSATPKGTLARARLRYDDGDTKICDSIKLIKGNLVRMICVVTDECYGDRIVLVYKRAE